MPELLKAVLNVVVAEERALDGPEDLTDGMRLQNGFYMTHVYSALDPHRHYTAGWAYGANL
jgi:hypothetical protein